MTKSVYFLEWQDSQNANEPIASLVVNFTDDPIWQISTTGEYHLSNVAARGVVVDNTANENSVNFTSGPLQITLAPFSKQAIALPQDTINVTLSGNASVVGCLFYIVNRNYEGNGVNSYALQKAVAAQIASLVGQTMGPIINPQFDIWPEGASIAVLNSVTYGPEGWCAIRSDANTPWTIKQVAGVGGTLFGSRLQRTAGTALLSPIWFWTQLSTADSCQYQGEDITLSYDLYRGANFSATGGKITVEVWSGIGTDQNLQSFSGAQLISQTTHELTPQLQRFSTTCNVPVNSTQLALRFTYAPNGVAGADDSFTVQRVQLDVAQGAQAYRPSPVFIELARCLQYFEIIGGATNHVFGSGFQINTTSGVFFVKYWRKRAVPAISFPPANTFLIQLANGNIVPSSLSLNLSTIDFESARPDFTNPAVGAAGGGCVVLGTGQIKINARM